jgi:hypothetical protein
MWWKRRKPWENAVFWSITLIYYGTPNGIFVGFFAKRGKRGIPYQEILTKKRGP